MTWLINFALMNYLYLNTRWASDIKLPMIRLTGSLETTPHMFDSLAGHIRGDILGVIA